MTLKRGVYGLIALLVVGAALWILRKRDARQDNQTGSTTLRPTEQEKLILDSRNHTISTVTRVGKVKRAFLPPRDVAVSISKDGKVTVTSRAYGTEFSPFIGLAYSDRARLALGADLLYGYRWEMGLFLGVSVSGGTSVRVGARVAYNLYNNTSLFLGVDNRGTPTGGISFKF